MVLSLRKWRERAKFIMLFLVFTFLIYHLLHSVSSWLAPQTRFGEPSGRAVKAYAADKTLDGGVSFSERLRFFYWYGE